MADDSRERMRTWDEVSSDYEARWRSRPEYRGMRWEDIMPGYWYGYEMAHDQQYQARSWTDIEAELRAGYPKWAERHGYGRDDRTLWERIKDGAREAWETVTRPRTYEQLGDREVPTTEMGLEGKRT